MARLNSSCLAVRCVHFKKTSKSALNIIIEENAGWFEHWLNREPLQLVEAGAMERHEAPVTLTFIPGATPEEPFAKCDADSPGRLFLGMPHGYDEIASFFEDLGFYGNGQRAKAHQSDLNVLIDKGRPSKICRDHDRGYGKDLNALPTVSKFAVLASWWLLKVTVSASCNKLLYCTCGVSAS